MIKQMLKTVLTTTALMTLASASFAAAPGGPKPNCPPGKIAVKENGMWKCEELKIQSGTPSHTMSGKAVGGFKAGPAKPPRAKPDIIVYSAEKSQTKNNVVVVHVQNIGKSLSKNGMVRVNAGGVKSSAAMPDLKPGQIRLVYVNFRTPVKSGRASVKADSTNVINESNEKNNLKHVTL